MDSRLIPSDASPPFDIIKTKVTEHTLEVWLSDGRIIVTPLSWYPTLQAATSKQRRAFENRGVGLAWEELDLDLSVEGMLAGKGNSQGKPALLHRVFSPIGVFLLRAGEQK